MAIPARTGRPWYVKEWWPSFLSLALGVIAGVFAIGKEASGPAPNGWQLGALVVGLVSVVALGALKLMQSLYKDARSDEQQSPEALRGPLQVMHGALASFKRVTDPADGWLRITFHRVDGEELEQSVDYVGSSDGGAGRKFSIHAGLIGRVARTAAARVFDRDPRMTHEQWVGWLVDRTGMTREAARRTRADRYAFLGIPIAERGTSKVRGVVYLDAGAAGFFDPATIALVLGGCEGLAEWVDERYYRA